MGTQQILLIVLSVIIVGVAIAVGITMFRNQAFNSNQTAIASEAQNYAAQIIQWWKTPTSLGGAGQDAANLSAENIANFIGFAADATYESESGNFEITEAEDGSVEIVTIGKENRDGVNPKTTTVITLATGDIQTTVSTEAVAEEE